MYGKVKQPTHDISWIFTAKNYDSEHNPDYALLRYVIIMYTEHGIFLLSGKYLFLWIDFITHHIDKIALIELLSKMDVWNIVHSIC